MRTLTILVLFVLHGGCKKQSATPEMRASCKPDTNLDSLICTVENVGKHRSRACVTAREQVPKAIPLVAQRVCTKMLEPGEKLTFKPKFDRYESLQPVCAPDGKWVCRDEIVETPAMLTENMPAETK